MNIMLAEPAWIVSKVGEYPKYPANILITQFQIHQMPNEIPPIPIARDFCGKVW